MDFIYTYHINLIFRIIVAGVCGILIGWERKNRAKEAGIRTHCIVACAATLMMIISKYGFFDMDFNGEIRLDPSRMAQGIVTGVGFLGAGMIYFQKGTLVGLTTASGIWAVSGIGMAIGAGMYVIGISSTLIILLIQLVFHSRTKIVPVHKNHILTIYGVNEEKFQKKVISKLSEYDVVVNDVTIKKDNGVFEYSFHIEYSDELDEEHIISLYNYNCTIE